MTDNINEDMLCDANDFMEIIHYSTDSDLRITEDSNTPKTTSQMRRKNKTTSNENREHVIQANENG